MADCEQLQEAYYKRWLEGLYPLTDDLQNAIDLVKNGTEPINNEEHRRLLLEPKVRKVMDHYRSYYKAKERASSQNILEAVVSQWKTPLEKAFMWFGGWRPSTAFQLVYGLVGNEVHEELVCLLEGCMGSLAFGSLSVPQLTEFSRLQMQTIQKEGKLEHEMALLQQSFADEPLLRLAQANEIVNGWKKDHDNGKEKEKDHDKNIDKEKDDDKVKEHMQEQLHHCRHEEEHHHRHEEYHHYHHRQEHHRHHHHQQQQQQQGEHVDHHGHVDISSAMEEKLESLKRISTEADSLRLDTLNHVLNNLEPLPKAIFMLAAAKLHIGFRKIGEHFNGNM